MNFTLNTTNDYHQQDFKTLGWELTVCNALSAPESPCRRLLKNPDSYGNLLYLFLNRYIPMEKVRSIIEVGGGYGSLMRDFICNKPGLAATMLDISPFLLQKQREYLTNDNIDYILQDILKVDEGFLRRFDMALFNENLGDLPTAVQVSSGIFKVRPEELPQPLQRIRTLYDRYHLPLPDGEGFNFNLGAVDVLEKLCLAAVSYIFLSEHSCEAAAPPDIQRYLSVEPAGQPERIALKGHDEYTITFSHLVEVGIHHGYNVIRGPMADYLEPVFSDRVMTALRKKYSTNDDDEIIQQFIYDLYKYEYIILMRKGKT